MVAFSDVLYKSMTAEVANCLHECSLWTIMSDVLSFYCSQENHVGRYIYTIGNTSNSDGIVVKSFWVNGEELQGDKTECK